MNGMTPDEACRRFWDGSLYVMQGLAASVSIAEAGELCPRTVIDIAADSSDKMILKFGKNEEKSIQMYSTAWMRSLDYLLYRYFTLILRMNNGPTEIIVPHEVQEKYNTYQGFTDEQQKKVFRFTPDYMSQLPVDTQTRDGLDYSVYKTTSCFGPAILNLFCHELFNRADNKKWRKSPRIDALIYQVKQKNFPARKSYTIYNYRLEDYFAHELLTGISLSTEITAILLDLDEEIRDISFKKFCKYVLKKIVRLPFPYARASAARYFFLQISLDWTKRKYQWSVSTDNKSIVQAVDHFASDAKLYIDTLYKASLRPEYPGHFHDILPSNSKDLHELLHWEQLRKKDFSLPQLIDVLDDPKVDDHVRFCRYLKPWYQTSYPPTNDPALMAAYKEQIMVNLEAVASPLNWMQVSTEEAHNLVAFTNPNHKYIPILMTYLENGTMDQKGSRKILPITYKDCENLFRSVHHAIREASIKAYSDMTWIGRYLDRI